MHTLLTDTRALHCYRHVGNVDETFYLVLDIYEIKLFYGLIIFFCLLTSVSIRRTLQYAMYIMHLALLSTLTGSRFKRRYLFFYNRNLKELTNTLLWWIVGLTY